MRRRAPRAIGAAVEELARAVAPATLLAEIQRAWPAAAGPALAREAAPTSERGGVVTLSCRSAVWAQELDLMASDLVARLNEELGRPAVGGLRCQTRATF
jgi:predicted nucleic acid-binding Zn ribbon protein